MPKLPDFDIAPVLEDLGADSVPRIRGSGHRKMLCPFHTDTTPSASVGQYSFRCFTCGVTGDAVKLLRTQGGLDYADAVARAETLTGGGGETSARTADVGAGWWSGSLLA